MNSSTVGPLPWYRSLSREQWRVLVASNLGWTFDGFEVFALFLTVGFALHQLLDASQYAQIPRYAGYILATTVFGWATGGVIGGIIADYIGRKRRMILAILAYSLTTGLERALLGLDFLRCAAFSRRCCNRVGMGDGGVNRLRIVARSRARPRRRSATIRLWARQHPRLRHLVAGRGAWPQCLAVDVPGGGVTGAADFMDSPEYPRIAALAGCQRASPSS
jgi:hypothetical protein